VRFTVASVVKVHRHARPCHYLDRGTFMLRKSALGGLNIFLRPWTSGVPLVDTSPSPLLCGLMPRCIRASPSLGLHGDGLRTRYRLGSRACLLSLQCNKAEIIYAHTGLSLTPRQPTAGFPTGVGQVGAGHGTRVTALHRHSPVAGPMFGEGRTTLAD